MTNSAAAALFLMRAASSPKVVEAEKFVLRDGADGDATINEVQFIFGLEQNC